MTYSGTYSTRTRDRFRIAVAAVTGVTAVAAFSATGWLAGAAAHDSQALQQEKQEKAAAAKAKYRHELAAWRRATAESRRAAHPPRIVLKQRPQRTEVTWRYVQGTAPSTVGAGSPVAAVPAASSPQPQSAPPPAPAPHPVPHPPPPAPAPSSGS